MKCDELKLYSQCYDGNDGLFYHHTEVYEAIAELKQKLHDAEMKADLAECANTEYRIDIDKLKAENERLKKEVWEADERAIDAGATSVEKMEELRVTQRALWIARAKRALEKIAWFKLWNSSISTMNPEDGARQEFDKWKNALGKFLKKAEEYK